MLRARTVAAFAADSFRYRIREVMWIVELLCFHARIGRMAEHATLRNRTTEVEMRFGVVSRRHIPALLLAVPGDRQLRDHAIRMMVKIGAGVVSGTNHITDLLFVNIDGPLFLIQKITLLDELLILP